MAAPRSWANLPLDAISEVTRRVLCTKDRYEVALACRTWRAALARIPPPPPPLPWLFLSSGDSNLLYCMLRGRSIDHQFNDDPVGARRFGSHDGVCLFAASHEAHEDNPVLHRLVDYRYGEIHPLPSMVCPEVDPVIQHFHPMLILAATLSDVPNVHRSVAAGIVSYQRCADGLRERRFAFWRMGAASAFDNMPPYDDPNSVVEDVLFRHRDGAFHFLTVGEDIVVCAPGFVEGGNQLGGVAATLHRFVPRDHSCDDYVSCSLPRGVPPGPADGRQARPSSADADVGVQGVPRDRTADARQRRWRRAWVPLGLGRAGRAGSSWQDAVRRARLLQIIRGG
ncbi:hypothetical protein ACP4OV_021496 [Aristida adscensionis]